MAASSTSPAETAFRLSRGMRFRKYDEGPGKMFGYDTKFMIGEHLGFFVKRWAILFIKESLKGGMNWSLYFFFFLCIRFTWCFVMLWLFFVTLKVQLPLQL